MNTQPIRIMIDFETPSAQKNAGILTFGAVQFGLPFGVDRPRFYERASLRSNETAGLHVDKATMEWWDKQSADARQEAFGGTEDVDGMLLKFEEWVTAWVNPDTALTNVELWSRGAGFDCEILQNAFYQIFGYYPFDFRKHMCQRTVAALMPPDLVDAVPKNERKHHALSDAIYQADVMDVALRTMSWNGRNH